MSGIWSSLGTTPKTRATTLFLAAAIALVALFGLLALPSPASSDTNQPPVVSIVTPSTFLVVNVGDSQTFTISASDSDGNLSALEWYVNDVWQGGQSLVPVSSFSSELLYTFVSEGNYRIKAVFTDTSGESNSATWAVSVSGQAVASKDYELHSGLASDVDIEQAFEGLDTNVSVNWIDESQTKHQYPAIEMTIEDALGITNNGQLILAVPRDVWVDHQNIEIQTKHNFTGRWEVYEPEPSPDPTALFVINTSKIGSFSTIANFLFGNPDGDVYPHSDIFAGNSLNCYQQVLLLLNLPPRGIHEKDGVRISIPVTNVSADDQAALFAHFEAGSGTFQDGQTGAIEIPNLFSSDQPVMPCVPQSIGIDPEDDAIDAPIPSGHQLFSGRASDVDIDQAFEGRDTNVSVKWIDESQTNHPYPAIEITIEEPSLGIVREGGLSLALPRTVWVDYENIEVLVKENELWEPYEPPIEFNRLVVFVVDLTLGLLINILNFLFDVPKEDTQPHSAIFSDNNLNCYQQAAFLWDLPISERDEKDGVRISIPVTNVSVEDQAALFASFQLDAGITEESRHGSIEISNLLSSDQPLIPCAPPTPEPAPQPPVLICPQVSTSSTLSADRSDDCPPESPLAVSAGGVHTCGLRPDDTVICWGNNFHGRSSPPPGSFASVSAGRVHTCGLRPDGTVACWGDDDSGQSSAPASSFASVSAGDFYTCGVKTDGTIACWGENFHGQLSAPSGSFTSVSAGGRHTCGLRTDGNVTCWGDDRYGQSSAPSGSFASVSAGRFHTCGLKTDGTVICWGWNDYGQSSAPSGSFTSVSAGGEHTCGLRTDGNVTCWGDDRYGQSSPPSGSFASISAGGFHTCGLKPDDTVACWGDDFYGQSSPPSGSFASVSAGGGHFCGVKTDGSVICWGWNDYGQSSPPSGSFASISAGIGHTCGLRPNDTVICWGDNEFGQSSPPSGSFASISAGIGHTCGVKTDGTVACWGDDDSGQSSAPSGSFASVSAEDFYTCGVKTDGSILCWGDGAYGQSSAPSGSFTSVSAGRGHFCGLKTDRSVICWGNNYHGQSSAPSGSFASVSAGDVYTCGLRLDGTVICWGNDSLGQSSPPSDSFTSVSAGDFYTCGVKTDSSIICWGAFETIHPADSCESTLSEDGTVSSSWSDDCASENRSGSYARYYTFTLTESAEVTVTLQSSVNTYLHLLEGAGRYGRSLYHNDDAPGAGTNSQIEETLSAGIYTIEATTYDAGVEGRFTLTISRLSGATGDDTLVDRYDANDNDQIDKSEVIAAVRDYLGGQITKAQVVEVIRLYISG